MLSRESDAEVDMAVELASMCKALKVLPRPGGLLDQDWYHVKLIKAGMRAFSILEEKQAKEQQAKAKR